MANLESESEQNSKQLHQRLVKYCYNMKPGDWTTFRSYRKIIANCMLTFNSTLTFNCTQKKICWDLLERYRSKWKRGRLWMFFGQFWAVILASSWIVILRSGSRTSGVVIFMAPASPSGRVNPVTSRLIVAEKKKTVKRVTFDCLYQSGSPYYFINQVLMKSLATVLKLIIFYP